MAGNDVNIRITFVFELIARGFKFIFEFFKHIGD